MAQPEIVKDIDARIIRPTSTDNAIVRFDGVAGQVQNSLPLIDDNGNITAQIFIGSLQGNAATATKLQTTRNIFGKSFDGTADITGKPLVYGTYTSTASNRYMNSGIEIRENGLVGSAQSDIGYAPSIGFHWSGIIAATMLFHNDGNFYLRKQDGVTRATLDANLNGNASSATALTTSAGSAGQAIYFANGKPVALDWRMGNSGTGEHDCNNVTYNFCGYYTSNGPATSIGATTTDGAIWSQAYSTSWIAQIAQDYRDGDLFVRGKNSGTWTAWKRIWATGDSVTGAVWNDYAECREADIIEPGYVLIEKGDDTLTKSTKRLQPFAGVSSDTWGFSQGETEKAKTPIAVAGRVLVYTYRDRNEYKPGDCVCTAPDGTIDVMTREEIINYPDRIVGTVSNVPNYETWGGGEGADRDPVSVNGRIWIKVK